MRLEISGGRSGGGRRVGHVIYLSGVEQRWLGEALMQTAPNLGRRLLAAQQSDLVVVGRGSELHALRERLDRKTNDFPDALAPVRHAAVDADDAAARPQAPDKTARG